MAFYETLIFGLIIGLGITYAHRWLITVRSNSRKEKALDVAILSRLNAQEIKKICNDVFPSWIAFPEFERAKWLNVLLKEMWPYINKAASEMIKDIVEPKLLDYKPIVIQDICIEKFKIGDEAPQVRGLKFQKAAENRIMLDIDLKWGGGHPSIVMQMSTGIVSMSVQLTDLQFFATARVILEMTGKIPCVGAVVVSLLAKPKPVVRYNLIAVGGSVTSIPGLSGIVDDIVHGALTDTLVWPKRIVVPIVPGYNTSHLEMKIQGRLKVRVVSAQNLKNVDLIGKSDPFVELWTRPLFRVATKVIDDTLNPVWDEEFLLDVYEFISSTIVLKVRDSGLLRKECLGVTEYQVSQLVPGVETEVTYFLTPEENESLPLNKDCGLGSITLKVSYYQYTREEQDLAMECEKEIMNARRQGQSIPDHFVSVASALTEKTKNIAGGSRSLVAKKLKIAVGAVSAAAKLGLSGASVVGRASFDAGTGAVSRVFQGPLRGLKTPSGSSTPLIGSSSGNTPRSVGVV